VFIGCLDPLFAGRIQAFFEVPCRVSGNHVLTHRRVSALCREHGGSHGSDDRREKRRRGRNR
jgi:hypothetical protein